MQYLILLIILNFNLFSQNILIKSKITDINGDPIENANIVCGDNGTTSNNLGQFTIDCFFNDKLIVKHISFEKNKLITSNIPKTIILNNKDIYVETVLVNGGLNNKIKLNNVDIIKERLSNKSNHHFEDIINSIPSINYSSGTSRPRYYQIRGIGELSQFSGEGAPHFYISTIIDNIDFSGIGGVSLLDDINQIEIFKGPQSTLFGPNAMGGAINFTSNKPTSNKKINYNINIGNYSTSKYTLTYNNPITNKLYFRTSISNYKTDSFIYNDYINSEETDAKNESLLKVSFLRQANNNKTVIFNLYLIDINNKYDQWTLDNNGYKTLTDYQGYDKQKTTAISIKRTIKLNKGILTRISTYSNNNILYSYDGDWANNDYWSNEYDWNENNESFSEDACNDLYGFPDCYYDYSFPDKTDRNKKQKTKEIRYSNGDFIFGVYLSELDENDIRKGWVFAGADSLNSIFKINNSSIYVQLKDKSKSKTKLITNIRLDNYTTKNKISYKKYNWQTHNYDYFNNIRTSVNDNLIGISFNLLHEFDEHKNMFFIFSNGYKTAGINQSPNFIDYKFYDTEKASNLELGYRVVKDKYSANITAFYIKRINPQFRVFGQINLLDPTSFDYGTINGSRGFSKGVEVNIKNYIRNITIYNSFTLLATHLDEVTINPFPNIEGSGIINCGGRENAHSPKIKHNIKLNFNLNNFIKGLTYTIERNYSDQFYFDDQNDNMANSKELINTNLKYSHKDKVIFNFWIKNLTDEIYQTRGYTFAVEPNYEIKNYQSFGDKRSYGINIELIK